jgi:hypothetical protein
MTQPDQNVWFTVNLAMRLKTTGALSYYDLSNRPAIDEAGSYYPILKSISSLGSAMGDYLPINSIGTITLDNSPGSFGFQRKFSDLLNRYTIVDQQVLIFSGVTRADELAPDVNQCWKGIVKSFKVSPQSGTLQIEVQSNPISTRVATKIIDAIDFPSAPIQAYGQALPVVFGTARQVKPTLISAATATAPEYAYATTLGNSSSGYINGGVTSYYVKDYDGVYRQLTSTVVSTERNGLGNTVTGGPQLVGTTTREYAWRTGFASASTDNYLATAMRFKLYGNNSAGTVSGKITFRVYADDGYGHPKTQALATAYINKNDYSAAFQANAAFDVTASFDKPFLFSDSTYYYLSIACTNESVPSLTKCELGGSGYNWHYRDSAASSAFGNEWLYDSTLTDAPSFCFYGCLFTDTADPASGLVSTQTGLGYSYFTVTQKTAGTGQTNPDITNLDLVASISGLRDNSSGTISGSANYQIVDTKYAAFLLDKEWSGSSWTGGRIDTSKYSANHVGIRGTSTDAYNRYIYGSTQGRATVADIFTDICRCSQSRLATVNSTSSGKYLGLWGQGQTVATSAVLTDEDCQIIEIDQRGVETIVNNVQGGYGRSFITVDPDRWLINGGANDRLGSISIYKGSDVMGTALATQSVASYGQRYLNDSQFDFIGEDASAKVTGRLIIAKYSIPTVYVLIDAPFFKYQDLELLNVIEILHPDLPAFFGSSSNPKRPTYDGVENDTLNNTFWKRAQRYRAQIEGMSREFNLGGYPTMQISARLLLNFPNDPT